MKTLKIGLLLLALAGGFTSCRKEGCTDPSSKNYDASAKKSNGNCKYEGSVVLWFNQATSNYLMSPPASSSLTFKIDNQIVASSGTNIYWTTAPNCGSSASITIDRDLGKNTAETKYFEATDQDGDLIFSGNIEFKANKCTSYQLMY